MEFLKKNTEQFNNNYIKELSNRFDLHENIIRLLFARGFDTADKIDNFLNAGITGLHNPFLLANMDKVVEKINYYIDNNKKILIMGDYDTDGISASAILYKYLESRNVDVSVFLPNRLVDGYGLTIESIDKVKKLYNPDLIITVDCGITCVNEIDYCIQSGIDIIVTDHHDIPEVTPNTLIINPKMTNQIYPFKELCGAGVALKLVHALGGLEEAMKYTTIATLATVADIVPLIDENRVIVKLGLANQTEQLPKGLKKLCSELKINLPMTSSDISFKMAPKINATGRMGDAIISFNLYIQQSDEDIRKSIDMLMELNDKRVNETNIIFEDACKMLEDTNVSRLGMIVLYNENWESGVLGIICSKLVEKYNKPVCLMSLVDGEFKGSCRSIPGVNIFDAMTNCKDLLIRFGGHNQAGGLSIERQNLKEFRNKINEYVLNNTNDNDLVIKKYYDLDLTNVEITTDFVKQLEVLEPTGFKNEKPTFKMQINNATVSRMPNHPQHLRIKHNNLNLIAFNKGEYYYNLSVNCNKEVIFELSLEKYGNKERISGFVRNINYSRLNTTTKTEVISANYLSQLKYINYKSEDEDFKEITYSNAISRINALAEKSKFGTCILVFNSDTYFKVVNEVKGIANFEIFDINNACGENVIIFSPNENINLKDYKNIFILDTYLCKGYLSYLSSKFNNLYVVNDKLNIDLLKSLDTNRHTFGIILNAIKVSKILTAPDMLSYFSLIKKENATLANIKFNEFKFFLMVMEELGILNINGVSIDITDIKNGLENSSIYNFIVELLKIK